MSRRLTYSNAIREALAEALAADNSVICFGLGVSDPKGVFGTTIDLHNQFGVDRVFDIPTSENAMTGIAIGAALNGLKPVLTHQRLDFALLSLDQLVNNAAKWRFMFGGRRGVGVTIRMIVGRGWGQGPTHSQSLQAWFAHIPGLKVVAPAFPGDAKGLLLSAIFDPDPVVFIEHRWLHGGEGDTPLGDHRTPIGAARVVCQGHDLTITAMSYATIEAVYAVRALEANGISCELIDLRSLSPIDWPTIEQSVRRTGRLLALDTGHLTGGIAGEVIARITSSCWSALKAAPQRLAAPDAPEATSPALTMDYHISAQKIAHTAAVMLGKSIDTSALARSGPHDVPGAWFSGPF